MAKPHNRGSLLSLRAGLARVQPVQVTTEIEQSILPGSRDRVKTHLQTDVSMPPAPQREPTVLMNAKLPVRLHTRLKRVAQFNSVSMTDILIRGIETELASGRYRPLPPEWEPGP